MQSLYEKILALDKVIYTEYYKKYYKSCKVKLALLLFVAHQGSTEKMYPYFEGGYFIQYMRNSFYVPEHKHFYNTYLGFITLALELIAFSYFARYGQAPISLDPHIFRLYGHQQQQVQVWSN